MAQYRLSSAAALCNLNNAFRVARAQPALDSDLGTEALTRLQCPVRNIPTHSHLQLALNPLSKPRRSTAHSRARWLSLSRVGVAVVVERPGQLRRVALVPGREQPLTCSPPQPAASLLFSPSALALRGARQRCWAPRALWSAAPSLCEALLRRFSTNPAVARQSAPRLARDAGGARPPPRHARGRGPEPLGAPAPERHVRRPHRGRSGQCRRCARQPPGAPAAALPIAPLLTPSRPY